MTIQRKYAFEVEACYQGYSLEDYIKYKLIAFDVGALRRLIYENNIRVNGQTVTPRYSLSQGDEVDIELPKGEDEIQSIPVDVLYENENFLIVNKPAGVPVTPLRGGGKKALFRESVKEYLLTKSPYPISKDNFPRIVHRIDQDTSGALVVAKNLETERILGKLFRERSVEKEYMAIVLGEVEHDGTISLPISPVSINILKMKIDTRKGKEAITHYWVEERFRLYTLLRVKIETGRTHQIRVHLASQGFPLAVDPTYGGRDALYLSNIKSKYRNTKEKPERSLISRVPLHSRHISFSFPDIKEKVDVFAPLPPDMELVLKMLRKYAPRKEHKNPGWGYEEEIKED